MANISVGELSLIMFRNLTCLCGLIYSCTWKKSQDMGKNDGVSMLWSGNAAELVQTLEYISKKATSQHGPYHQFPALSLLCVLETNLKLFLRIVPGQRLLSTRSMPLGRRSPGCFSARPNLL